MRVNFTDKEQLSVLRNFYLQITVVLPNYEPKNADATYILQIIFLQQNLHFNFIMRCSINSIEWFIYFLLSLASLLNIIRTIQLSQITAIKNRFRALINIGIYNTIIIWLSTTCIFSFWTAVINSSND